MSEQERPKAPRGGLCSVDGIEYYRIDGVERMQPFLMTVVSDSDLWMFVSSTGALTAGRVDADHALFPYETDDKLHRAAGEIGPATAIARTIGGQRELWRPFGADVGASCTRSIAKSVLGDRLVFEEHNLLWDVRFRSTWAPSASFGWVRFVELTDLGGKGLELEVMDGLLDVMPAGVDALTEQTRSNLVDSYKRSETGPWGTLAVFTLESLITDRPEPAESLTATTVWSVGFGRGRLHLDQNQLGSMSEGQSVEPTTLVTGRPGAYLLHGPVSAPPSGSASWLLVADTGLDHAEVLAQSHTASDSDAARIVTQDVAAGSERLRGLLGDADAFQITADGIADAHHLSNVLFNSMRGGVFPYGNRVPIADLIDFFRDRNLDAARIWQGWFDSFGQWADAVELREAALAAGDPDLIRLVLEYLPLTFSRRHGDPSRPWNRFSIRVRDNDGGDLLNYEGNWRDIFQNWEALLRSFPSYYSHVVAKFVNASTTDGHNPYRISRTGIDWEIPDSEDPWSHIGYWGDHQIIYLLRLLEAWQDHQPGAIGEWLDRPVFVYGDVPYLITDHEEMTMDPRNTITFDDRRAEAIGERELKVGSDGRLVVDTSGGLLRVGLLEKLLVPALAKLSSLVPDGGIWLNTQRPEWNDANNALAGPGLSMVTLYHLRRYLVFLQKRLDDIDAPSVALTASVVAWCNQAHEVLNMKSDSTPIDDVSRRSIVDSLGQAAAEHRGRMRRGIDSVTEDVSIEALKQFCAAAVAQVEGSIGAGRRDDGLYHSYNSVSFPTEDAARVDHLGVMLEGQVAALSSGALTSSEALKLVRTLFDSGLYRPDQNTFILYPIVELTPFLERNVVPTEATQATLQLASRADDALRGIFSIDVEGQLRFRPDIINEGVLAAKLSQTNLAIGDRHEVATLYERVFHHSSFTGRSGSMYGYEGIGSVYWHMVAKLLLAVQECYWSAVDRGESADVVNGLAGEYRRIRNGLGFQKEPQEFGAFPTDCYSHTPTHAGAQQPGMTGQVKEEVLTRFGEFGLRVNNGRISLSPGLLPAEEILPVESGGGLGTATFTFCAVPMTMAASETNAVVVVREDQSQERRDGLSLTPDESKEIFARSGAIRRVEWTVQRPGTVS